MKQTEKVARCGCGQLKFTVEGEPSMATICHCLDCQRRTGTSHQISAWYENQQVIAQAGEFKIAERVTAGGLVRSELCPKCGTTVSWTSSFTAHARGFATGCFADPQFPAPKMEFYTCRRHHWMKAVEGAPQFDTQPEG